MSRPKGTPKTGGRVKGTPNKVTGTLKSWITDLINCNRSQMEKDLKDLDPKDRLMFLEKMPGGAQAGRSGAPRAGSVHLGRRGDARRAEAADAAGMRAYPVPVPRVSSVGI